MVSATETVETKLPTNPRFFPDDLTPSFIIKSRNGHIHFVMKEPKVGERYLWYMSNPKCVSKDELFLEMKVPGRRWYACDQGGYELQKKAGSNATTGEPFICLRNFRNAEKYWFGHRHGEPPVDDVTLVLTIAEVYLKSMMHQKRYIFFLIKQIKRVLDNPMVLRSGNTMVEVRKTKPTPEQIKLLSLIPGIGKIYEGVGAERGGDPRKELLMSGIGGIPIDPSQVVLALISGGIDSPVAAYRMMTRGCFVNGIHFLNSTSQTASVVEKNRRIAERLSLVQGRFDMHYVDISKLQTQIVASVPNNNRTLVYKWFMLSLSAGFDRSFFIVTGDSTSQVASQTVINISTLYPSVSKAVVAPLIGLPKETIIEEARKIGTYALSILEGADCCQYMMCKSGANLCMGRSTLESYVRKIQPTTLPVIKESFRDGVLSETTRYTYTPALGLRAADGATPTPLSPVKSSAATGGGEEEESKVLYFDAAAGTMLAEPVKLAMLNAPEGNPTSMHQTGCEARMAVEQVRAALAAVMNVPASDLIFTAGGTESNNIALHGYQVEREAWSHSSTRGSSAVAEGATVVRVVDLVNHETGSVTCTFKRPPNGRLHVDASQALTKVDFRTLDLSEVDSMTVTAHKINGPVGAGALYLRDLKCNRMYTGGSQEKGIRPGTENVPAIVGFGAALNLDRSCSVHREIEAFIVKELEAVGCEINRRGETSGYIVHASLPEGYDNTEFVSRLSTTYRVEIGTGSACKTNVVNTTVYDTLGKKPLPSRSIRLSWDCFNTMQEAERVVAAFRKVIAEKRPSRR